jgi:cytochrome P450
MALDALPPGPRTPAVAQTLRYLSDPVGLMRACAERHGELFTLKLSGVGDLVLTTSPHHAGVLRSEAPAVQHGDEAAQLFAPQGDVLPSSQRLHGRMREQAGLVRRAADRVVRGLARGAPFSLLRALQDITLPAMLGALLGTDQGPNAALAHALEQLAGELQASPLLAFHALRPEPGAERRWGPLRDARSRAAALLHAEVRRRRETPRGHDLLALLLDADAGAPSCDRLLADALVATLLAAHETSSTALAWTLEAILSRPAVRGRLLDELGPHAPHHDAPHERQPYLAAVLRESLRLRPLLAVGDARLLDAPLRLAEYWLPAGTYVGSCVPGLLRRPELHREPDEFRPQRFGEHAPGPYELGPLCAARHGLAASLALCVLEVVLATLLSSARLELACSGVRARLRGRLLAPEAGLPVSYLGPA